MGSIFKFRENLIGIFLDLVLDVHFSSLTVVSFVVYLPRILLPHRHTKVKHGCFWVLPIATLFCTMMNSKKLKRKVFESTTRSLVNKTTVREEKCTSKTRSRNIPMRFSRNLKMEPISTSVA